MRTPASHPGRRQVLAAGACTAFMAKAAQAGEPPYRIAFANINEAKDVRIEGLGFTGLDVRRSFELAARSLPVEMIYYDNAADAETAVENAIDAAGRKVDLLIEYNAETSSNAEIARRMAEAGVPVLAINYPVGNAPLYTDDNLAAGKIAGSAAGAFAKESWPGETAVALILGDVGDPGDAVTQRTTGIMQGLRDELPAVQTDLLDTGGQAQRGDGLLTKYLAQHSGSKVLVATLDDPTALWARSAVELQRRSNDCVIVSQGLDRSIHGGASEKKEIDPANRASPVLGSVAYYLDRYGYLTLPLALRMLRGETVPARTVTRHVLVGSANVFREYPPTDMN